MKQDHDTTPKRPKRRTPSDFVTKYLRKHDDFQMSALAKRLADQHAQVCANLTVALADAQGYVLLPPAGEGHIWAQVPMETPPQQQEAG